MHLTLLFSTIVLLTGVASANPIEARNIEARDIETIVFDRDHVLDKRGLELADMHGVNITEMYRHALVRRSDGDDYTIWVDNSFTDEEGPLPAPDTEKRGLRGVNDDNLYLNTDFHDMCGSSSFRDLTDRGAAYTGGVKTIVSWGRSRKGRWSQVTKRSGNNHRGLVIAGSNSGANAIFMVRPHQECEIGTYDVSDLARDSLSKYARSFPSGYGERVAATGGMRCDSWDPRSFGHRPWVDWRLTKTDQRV